MTSRVTTRPQRPAGSTRSRQDARAGWLLITPTTLVVALVVVLPFLAVVVLAFQDIRLAQLARLSFSDLGFTFDNILRLFRSPGFWTSLRTTSILAVSVSVFSVLLGTASAIALRKPFRGRAIVRAVILVPYVLPVVASMQTWRTLLNTQHGFINAFGQRFLGWDQPIAFLTTPGTALVWVIVVLVWTNFPLAYLFVAARLHAVPGDLEEAAALDGAGPFQRIRHVILPELTAVISIMLLLRFVWTFQTFNEVYLLTGGAAGTQVLAVRVFDELIGRSNIGAASGVGVAITLILAVILTFYFRYQRRQEAQR